MGAISTVILLALVLASSTGGQAPPSLTAVPAAPSTAGAQVPSPAGAGVRPSVPATARTRMPGPTGRVAFTTQSFTAAQSGQALPGFSEMVVSAMLASPTRDKGGTEYRVDFRGAGYPQTVGRSRRISVYDAYVGQRFANGVAVRAGQMWLNDLGGLGALGGVLGEVTRQNVGRLRRHLHQHGGRYGRAAPGQRIFAKRFCGVHQMPA